MYINDSSPYEEKNLPYQTMTSNYIYYSDTGEIFDKTCGINDKDRYLEIGSYRKIV